MILKKPLLWFNLMMNNNNFFQQNINYINSNVIDKYANEGFKKQQPLIKKILRYNSNNVKILSKQERSFPGNEDFYNSGYYKTMLKRYLFAGELFCQSKTILDACCGLGWGTQIIDQYAKNIVAFDIDKQSISFCKKTWNTHHTTFKLADALNLSNIPDNSFDVALGMETIEHFSKENGENHIKILSSKLQKNGYLIGTSSFPLDEKQAENLCKTNEYHLHIFTYNEIVSILEKYFSEYVIIDQWMFIGKK